MFEYKDELQHEKLDYIRVLTKSERNRIDYYRRQLKAGIPAKQIARSAKISLQRSEERQLIVDNCIKMNSSATC